MPTLLIVQVGLALRDSGSGDCERHTTSVVLDTIVSTMHETQDTSHRNEHVDSRYP